jgi:hypothetical protein
VTAGLRPRRIAAARRRRRPIVTARWRRGVAAAGIVLLIAAGLFVHLALPDTSATDIAGDALYAGVAYLLVVAVLPRVAPWFAALIAGAWCVAVELFQLTGLPETWGAAFTPVMLVLGTVFDLRDLLVYAATVAALAALDAVASATLAR